MAQDNKAQSEIRYLNPVSVDVKKKKYCRFKKLGINVCCEPKFERSGYYHR